MQDLNENVRALVVAGIDAAILLDGLAEFFVDKATKARTERVVERLLDACEKVTTNG